MKFIQTEDALIPLDNIHHICSSIDGSGCVIEFKVKGADNTIGRKTSLSLKALALRISEAK